MRSEVDASSDDASQLLHHRHRCVGDLAAQRSSSLGGVCSTLSCHAGAGAGDVRMPSQKRDFQTFFTAPVCSLFQKPLKDA